MRTSPLSRALPPKQRPPGASIVKRAGRLSGHVWFHFLAPVSSRHDDIEVQSPSWHASAGDVPGRNLLSLRRRSRLSPSLAPAWIVNRRRRTYRTGICTPWREASRPECGFLPGQIDRFCVDEFLPPEPDMLAAYPESFTPPKGMFGSTAPKELMRIMPVSK